ncbi:MAG TPA: hypothetical protein GXX72_00395 [Clostridiaceae bacterium]|nr:hypothetical protein [Clostridiaceae bacterium]
MKTWHIRTIAISALILILTLSFVLPSTTIFADNNTKTGPTERNAEEETIAADNDEVKANGGPRRRRLRDQSCQDCDQNRQNLRRGEKTCQQYGQQDLTFRAQQRKNQNAVNKLRRNQSIRPTSPASDDTEKSEVQRPNPNGGRRQNRNNKNSRANCPLGNN